MADRYYALTVSLEHDLRKEEIESLISAIQMLKGVLRVDSHVSTPETHVAFYRARQELIEKLYETLKG